MNRLLQVQAQAWLLLSFSAIHVAVVGHSRLGKLSDSNAIPNPRDIDSVK